MSAKPKILPATSPVEFPMSPQEAHQIGMLQAQQAALNAAFDALGAQACARLGLAIGTKLHADPQRGVYTVG